MITHILRKTFTICLFSSALNAFLMSPEDLIKTLTLRQKIAQLFIVAAASNFNQPTEQLSSSLAACPYNMDLKYIEHLITAYGVGGIIFLYKSDPETQIALTQNFQQLASIPLLIAQDCEWGLSMRLDIDPTKVVRYPRNITLGAIQNEQLIYAVAKEIGKQCRALGVHMNLAPVVDVNNNKENPVIHDRSFGDDSNHVAQLATLFIRGFHDAGILACAKHFPGHGDTNIDSHIALPIIKHDRPRLNSVELTPFKAAIESNVDAIMHAHLHVPALDGSETPSSLSYNIVTTLLQEELGYQGLNITDGLGMGALTQQYAPGEIELKAFLAGNDILLCPLDVPHALDLIEQAITNGIVTEEELNRRVLKILHAKKRTFEQQQKCTNIETIKDYLIRPKAHALQEQAYRAAVTFLPQHKNILFNQENFETSCILQIGKLRENTFIQKCKQHKGNVFSASAALIPNELNVAIATAQKYETVIVVLGEMNKILKQNFGINENVHTLIAKLRTMHKNILVVLFGTPYSIELFQDVDALLIAYEDAPAAQRAAVDVLRGNLKPVGRLPITVLFHAWRLFAKLPAVA